MYSNVKNKFKLVCSDYLLYMRVSVCPVLIVHHITSYSLIINFPNSFNLITNIIAVANEQQVIYT